MNSTSQTPVSRAEYEAVLATNSTLQKQLSETQEQLAALTIELERLQAMLRLSQQARFGRSSERKTISPDQLDFFNDVEKEAEAKPQEAEPTLETVTIRRRKQKGKREADLSLLPQEVIEHKLAEADRHCPTCDTLMDCILRFASTTCPVKCGHPSGEYEPVVR